jgi:hypothetical protein
MKSKDFDATGLMFFFILKFFLFFNLRRGPYMIFSPFSSLERQQR